MTYRVGTHYYDSASLHYKYNKEQDPDSVMLGRPPVEIYGNGKLTVDNSTRRYFVEYDAPVTPPKRARKKSDSEAFASIEATFIRMEKEAQALVEKGARDLMRRYPVFASCCAAMGSFSFYDKDGRPIDEEDVETYNRNFSGMRLTKGAAAALLKFKNDYMYKFTDLFHCKWSPVRWDGPDGERVTDW